ncbi:MAG: hypothetical protein RL757_3234 [Bacteroidota bacterium]|jgi:hypothetical protein
MILRIFLILLKQKMKTIRHKPPKKADILGGVSFPEKKTASHMRDSFFLYLNHFS